MAKKPKATCPKPTTVDFETQAILSPKSSTYVPAGISYPPVPVGVSIKEWGKKAKYYAWGHLVGNNCRFEEAKQALEVAYRCPDGVLFQNAKFDLRVAEIHFGLMLHAWERVHDTMFLLFLDDPHQRELGLKPSADRLLGLAPEERDAVQDWLLKHQPLSRVGTKLSGAKNGKNYFMGYLEHAPGDVVGPYADGDTIRTEEVFKHLWAKNLEREMAVPYDRERRLLPVLMENEKQGVRVDVKRLAADVATFERVFEQLDEWVCKRLKAPGLDVGSGDQLVEALVAQKLVDLELLGITAKGNLQTNKDALGRAVADRQLSAVLRYRSQLQTCLGTFMRPWLATALMSNGLIFTSWNQTRGDRDGGTRTGRLSSTPNFQNLPKEFSPIFLEEMTAEMLAELKKLKIKFPPKRPFDFPPLPQCRGYIVPWDQDHVLLGRDFSQQEPRILGHFEGGMLMEQYLANPWIDYHDNAREHLQQIMMRDLPRKAVKGINLGIIYGMGDGKMAEQTGLAIEEVKEIRKKIYQLYEGLGDMYKDMKFRAKSNLPFRTWGGREYYCEPAKINAKTGRLMSFDYKMLNALIQGSAADFTKEALIRLYDKMVELNRVGIWKIYFNVHDELVLSAPKTDRALAMETMRVAMESPELDVPMLSEGAYSNDNWNSMLDWDKKGKPLVA